MDNANGLIELTSDMYEVSLINTIKSDMVNALEYLCQSLDFSDCFIKGEFNEVTTKVSKFCGIVISSKKSYKFDGFGAINYILNGEERKLSQNYINFIVRTISVYDINNTFYVKGNAMYRLFMELSTLVNCHYNQSTSVYITPEHYNLLCRIKNNT